MFLARACPIRDGRFDLLLGITFLEVDIIDVVFVFAVRRDAPAGVDPEWPRPHVPSYVV